MNTDAINKISKEILDLRSKLARYNNKYNDLIKKREQIERTGKYDHPTEVITIKTNSDKRNDGFKIKASWGTLTQSIELINSEIKRVKEEITYKENRLKSFVNETS